MVKIKKNVVWADELEDVKEISITKIAFNSGTSASIKQMFSSIEAFMPLAANRNKSLKINEFKEAYENVSRKNFDELTFRAFLSVYPEAYNVKVSGNILHVKFNGKAKPNDLFERKEGFIDKTINFWKHIRSNISQVNRRIGLSKLRIIIPDVSKLTSCVMGV